MLATPLWRLVILLAMILAGWELSHLLDLHGIANTPQYLYGATTVLAIGLYGSTAQISRLAVRHLAIPVRQAVTFRPVTFHRVVFRPETHVNIRIVGLAVTVGVVVKAALITLVMYAAYQEPLYLVLGLAMAQIDPLSVVALRRGLALSERAKAILHAWSSFDDPVTMLLTIYWSALVLNTMGMSGGLVEANPLWFALNLLLNLAFAVGAAIVWWVLARSAGMPRLSDSDDDENAGLSPRLNLVAVIVLAALFAVAVWQVLLLGITIAGLFFRPRLGQWLNHVTWVALLLASLALGVLLVDYVAWRQGLVLGVTAFVAQIAVAWMLTRKLSLRDRGFLALSQQSGITAIILALLLERSFTGTVAVVAPAIIVINMLHVCSTTVFARIIRPPATVTPPITTPQSPVAEIEGSAESNAACTRPPKSLNEEYMSASRVDPNVSRNDSSALPVDSANSSSSISRNSGRTS